MRHSFFYDGVLESLAHMFRPRAPDMADLPDTAETILRQIRADYANEAKFPSRRRRLQLRAQGIEVAEPAHPRIARARFPRYRRKKGGRR